jgi:probable F420-dependent oxidoreductase
VRIGLSVYDMPTAEVVRLAAAADEAGFESIWLGEHVMFPAGYESVHPSAGGAKAEDHRSGPPISADTQLSDPLVLIGALGAITTRLRLATGVYILPLRHPVVTARSCCTAQEVCGGRFIFGVGMGWLREEFDCIGVPFTERSSRFDESIDVLRAAWGGGPVTHRGRHFSMTDIQVTRDPIDVPLMFGGNGNRALERAARLGDGWFSSGMPDPTEATRLRHELLRLRGAGDRSHLPFRIVVRIAGADPSEVERYANEGFDEVLIWADQVWPRGYPLEQQRARLFEVASTLGLSSVSPRRTKP